MEKFHNSTRACLQLLIVSNRGQEDQFANCVCVHCANTQNRHARIGTRGDIEILQNLVQKKAEEKRFQRGEKNTSKSEQTSNDMLYMPREKKSKYTKMEWK